jgi:hypothetical protein
MQEHLLDTIEKQINNSKVYNEFMVYSSYASELATKIFNHKEQGSDEFGEYCNIFHSVSDSMITSANKLKAILPIYQLKHDNDKLTDGL